MLMSEIDKKIERLRRKIELLKKVRDVMVARRLDKIRRSLEAAYDARIKMLEWRINNLERRRIQIAEDNVARYYIYRKYYYLSLGFPEEIAKSNALGDTISWIEGLVERYPPEIRDKLRERLKKKVSYIALE